MRIESRASHLAIVTMLPLGIFALALMLGLAALRPAWIGTSALLGGAALVLLLCVCIAAAFWFNRRLLAATLLVPIAKRVQAADMLLLSRIDSGDNTPTAWDRQIKICEATLASRPEGRVTQMLNAREQLLAALMPAYLRRYQWSGVRKDVERATQAALDSLALHGSAPVARAIDHIYLSACYREAYWTSGVLAQLDAAIAQRKLAAHVLAPHLPARFEDDLALVELYRWRYEELGEEDDLAEMRRRILQAGAGLDATELNDDAQAQLFMRALCAAARAELDGRQPQLDQALHLLSASLAVHEIDMLRHVTTLRALTHCRVLKFREKRDAELLVQALADLNPALATLPTTSPQLPPLLREQGDVLMALWHLSGHAPTLQEAINALQQAYTLLPEACIQRPDYQRALAVARAAATSQPLGPTFAQINAAGASVAAVK
jgi:hypothetical protein